MTSTFELDGATVRVPVPDGWEAALTDGRVTVVRGPSGETPRTSVDIALREGEPRELLEDELAGCTLRLTDFTILHLEPRVTAAGNWTSEPPPMPFAFGGYRAGVFSAALEIGVVGADDRRSALAFVLTLAEELSATQTDVDTILAGIEIDW